MVSYTGKLISLLPSPIPLIFFAVHLNLVSLQKRKKMPPLPQPEEGHALTHEAKELGLTSSEEARLVTNFVKTSFLLRNNLRESH